MNYSIRFIPNKNIYDIIPFLKMLDNSMHIETLKERLTEMLTFNYQCAGVYDGNTLIGVSGVWILYKYYIGKHLEVDNVMIHPDYRGQGLGILLMNWINAYGKSIDCVATELNCYIGNDKANKFWETFGYTKLAFHYRKTY